ncbi:MAG: AMP-binding protein [Deltaproteobacteria bacterium]|jgi:acyl-CoA synthetase (AMP-forming)/AMP-acid ligase II|nr:AMP-binding protein [Deltaproteobacteria bacterium]MBT4265579.1 AMP-binding protein [Deltaproteobacteria bacterium]MBT4639728.1 AMP-binding protein [Deltaproteobacteria bacterium]MBT6501569.1 AMP-binding protein [Deltaproteobacteria bacterium]MBT7716669.1 AMP-binding protein [Deltaproteobacteria bacterium]
MTVNGFNQTLAVMIRENAAKFPGLPVLTFVDEPYPDEILTYADIESKGNRLANSVIDAGICSGDKVAIIMKNHPEAILALYATSLIGAVLVPLDPHSSGDKLGYQLRHAGAKGVFFSLDILDRMMTVLEALPHIHILGVRTKNIPDSVIPDGFPDLDQVLNETTPSQLKLTPTSNKNLMIIYTPGTTGIPKGVMIDQNQWDSQKAIHRQICKYKKTDIIFTSLPLAYGNAWKICILPALTIGIRAVVSREFSSKHIWDICRRHHCNIISCFGGHLSDFYAQPVTKFDGDNPVKTVISSNTPKKIWRAFEKRFQVKIHEWYLTMEGGIAHNPPGTGPVGSFGKPLESCCDMKVLRDDGTDCEPNEPGELAFKLKKASGESIYFKPLDADRTIQKDGWIRTADIVHKDENGWLFFDSRKKDQLSQGEFILAREIEEVIVQYPQIKHVAVYGVRLVSGSTDHQDTVTSVVPERNVQLSIEGLIQWCRERLPLENIPTYIQIVDRIPKTGTEKILYRQLESDFQINGPDVYYSNDYIS